MFLTPGQVGPARAAPRRTVQRTADVRTEARRTKQPGRSRHAKHRLATDHDSVVEIVELALERRHHVADTAYARSPPAI
jgi:hypothetical protein